MPPPPRLPSRVTLTWLLLHHEQGRPPGPHGHRRAADADLQAPRRQERAPQPHRPCRGSTSRSSHTLDTSFRYLQPSMVNIRPDGPGPAAPAGQLPVAVGQGSWLQTPTLCNSSLPDSVCLLFLPILELGKLRPREGNEL